MILYFVQMAKKFEYTAYLFLSFLVNSLPLEWVRGFGRKIGRLIYHIYGSRRNVALENLRNAYPERGEEELHSIAMGAFENVGITLLEFLWSGNFSKKSLKKYIDYDGLDKINEVIHRGKGAVLVSGHLGNWELMALATGVFLELPVKIIVKAQHNEFVDRAITKLRCHLGNTVLPMEVSVKESLTTLRNGGCVAMLSDQSAPKEGCYVIFFGRNTATFKGPASFSLKSRAPIVMLYNIRQTDGNFKILTEEIPMDDLQDYTEDNITELTRRHVARLEEWIRRYPDQWLWMHRRWKNVQ